MPKIALTNFIVYFSRLKRIDLLIDPGIIEH